MFPRFMTSSLRHNTKFCGLFWQFLKVQTNIYARVASDKHHLKWISSYIQLRRSRFAFFRLSRQSGTIIAQKHQKLWSNWRSIGLTRIPLLLESPKYIQDEWESVVGQIKIYVFRICSQSKIVLRYKSEKSTSSAKCGPP